MTAIEWTHRAGTVGRTWNPVTGCQKVSEGCRHCYAETVANRFWPTQYPAVLSDGRRPETIPTTAYDRDKAEGLTRPRRFTDVWTHPDRLDSPLHWRTPATVFVNSMSDLFHEAVPDEFIDRVFAVMQMADRHTFIVLTKRPARMVAYLSAPDRCARIDAAVLRCWADIPEIGRRVGSQKALVQPHLPGGTEGWPLLNAWLGVSVENQATADERIPLLLQTPSALRFVSAEPLLGPVELSHALLVVPSDDQGPKIPRIDWLIVGGESGPQARPCDTLWIRSLRDQAATAGVPCFIKQLGSNPVETNPALGGMIGRTAYPLDRLTHSKGADPSEWPEDLRVREWPEVTR
jgi:protein gp37